MPKNLGRALFSLFICLILLVGCDLGLPAIAGEIKPTLPASVTLLPESEVKEIPLIGPASEARAEISGMAWCSENLVLLPQYPNLFGEGNGANIFIIPGTTLDGFFSGEYPDGITPDTLPFETGGLERTISGFEGFEAIVFNGDELFVSIEARQADGMMGYLVKGSVDHGCSRMVLDPDSIVSLPPQADIGNMSHETLVIYQDRLYAIYEANGINVNSEPLAHVFDLSLESHTTVDLPNIEYRLTDASSPDSDGEFWTINYLFSGDTRKLKPAPDLIALEYGVGVSHQNADAVERLIRFRIDKDGIRLVNQAPIYLALSDGESRNWEGIVHYRDSFLLVTDKFPSTILAYVEATSDN